MDNMKFKSLEDLEYFIKNKNLKKYFYLLVKIHSFCPSSKKNNVFHVEVQKGSYLF